MSTSPADLAAPGTTTGAARPHRRHRWARRLLAAAAGLALLGVVGLAVLWPVTPGVGDAERRVAAILAVHGAHDPGALPSPDPVGQAVVATEDSRFYRHHGIDALGVLRAVVGSVEGWPDPGGATLEQQLAKNLWTPDARGVAPKVEQVVLALKLDTAYTKRQVLEMYLSVVYFGHGFYGLPAAARGFFGRAPNALTWAQASLLAGLVQAPSAYDPYAHADRARHRQHHVLDRLVATGVLTRAQADAAWAAPWGLLPT